MSHFRQSDRTAHVEVSGPDPDLVKSLQAHIAELEAELARYSASHGMTEEARRLFVKPKIDDPDASKPLVQSRAC